MILTGRVEDFAPVMHIVGVNVRWLDTLLLLLRHPQKPYGNCWGVPAGKKQCNESVIEAAARELFEETGLMICADELTYITTYRVRYSDCDFYCSSFECLITSKPEITLNPSEHIDYQWMQPQKALSLPLMPDGDYSIRDYFRLPQTNSV